MGAYTREITLPSEWFNIHGIDPDIIRELLIIVDQDIVLWIQNLKRLPIESWGLAGAREVKKLSEVNLDKRFDTLRAQEEES